MSAGEGGKTLLAGFSDTKAIGAWAAGLRGSIDHPHFVVFARYLLQQGEDCAAYWLMLPGDSVGHYQVEMRTRDDCWLGDARYDDAVWQFEASRRNLPMENLLLPGQRLPGLMRRELDAMAEQLSTVLPEPFDKSVV